MEFFLCKEVSNSENPWKVAGPRAETKETDIFSAVGLQTALQHPKLFNNNKCDSDHRFINHRALCSGTYSTCSLRRDKWASGMSRLGEQKLGHEAVSRTPESQEIWQHTNQNSHPWNFCSGLTTTHLPNAEAQHILWDLCWTPSLPVAPHCWVRLSPHHGSSLQWSEERFNCSSVEQQICVTSQPGHWQTLLEKGQRVNT